MFDPPLAKSADTEGQVSSDSLDHREPRLERQPYPGKCSVDGGAAPKAPNHKKHPERLQARRREKAEQEFNDTKHINICASLLH